MEISNVGKARLELAANTVRMLSADAVEKAQSGHPGMPMGMADLGMVLWLKHLRFNPQDPKWIARDRFVLSNGHGSMFLYSMLHLFGYELSLDDLKAFRQWESKTPGHPENYMTAGVECTTGPLGQGISNAVGMAIGQKLIKARYGEGTDLFDNRIFVFAGDGCLMEGVSSEASSMAGHLGLGNMIVIYDDNHISIAGGTELAFSEDVIKRYEAYGWHVQRANGHDFGEMDAAIKAAVAETGRPSIIAARTIIGKGSPNREGTRHVHGEALGKDELELTKKKLNWPLEPTFLIPDDVRKLCAERVEELKGEYGSWQKRFTEWKSKNAEKAAKLEAQIERRTPKDLLQKLLTAVPKDGKPISTRKLSGEVLQVASREVNAVIGGSADLEPSTLTLIKDSPDIQKGHFEGLNLRFGVREHGMGAVMNGLAYYGGFIPYGSTFFCFLDYMKPTVRLAAVSHLQSLFIYTHESVFLGEDGPTHQPIEHIQSLRAVPNVYVLRPADGIETAVCYAIALERKNGPSALLFTRQNVDFIERAANFDPNEVRRGAYPVYQAGSGDNPVVFVATGSEVGLAIATAKLLSASCAVKVVSMPCWELFAEQPESYRQALIPRTSRKVVIEAGASFGWHTMVDGTSADTVVIGIDHFGASAPAKILAEKFGFTPQAVLERVKKKFVI